MKIMLVKDPALVETLIFALKDDTIILHTYQIENAIEIYEITNKKWWQVWK